MHVTFRPLLAAALMLCSSLVAAERAATLAEAMLKEDLQAIRAAVSVRQQRLGDLAGVPQVAERYSPLPSSGELLSEADVERGFTPFFAELETAAFWKVGMDPSKMTQPLRAPASVLAGCTAVCRAKLAGADRCLAIAKQAAEFLMWAQQQAGTGGYPFPVVRGARGDRAMAVADDFLTRVDKAGRVPEVTRNGWIIDDLNTGALQFDNGECGVAMFDYYLLTGDTNALASARRSADWAVKRPLVPNFNYNSFSVYLLAKAYQVTHDEVYLSAAKRKAQLGIIPGQLLTGPHAGRWVDRHNSRPGYHYIMMRSLAQLLRATPEKDHARHEIRRSLVLGLRTRNSEIIHKGAFAKEKVLETLVLVNTLFADEPALARDALSAEALTVLGRGMAVEAKAGTMPVAPGAWGPYLEFLSNSRQTKTQTALH